MVVTRNNGSPKTYKKPRRMKDMSCVPDLRPRVSAPNYREESPEDYFYRHKILNVKVNRRKSLTHQLRIQSNNTRKKAINVIHKYKLRQKKSTFNSDRVQNKPDVIKDVEENKDEDNGDIKSVSKPTIRFRGDSSQPKPNFKCRMSSFNDFEQHNQTPPKCYENDRRYPVRMRRPITDRFMVNYSYKSNKKSNWNDSLISPRIENILNKPRFRKWDRYSKQSDTDETEDELLKDEMKFERRCRRSLFRARSELKPINMGTKDITKDLLQDHNVLPRSSLADIEPMAIDKNITFRSVGGNKQCIQALKESVILPLVYPEVFQKLAITPPRGLLFHGPPGSGKTLVARALVNECAQFHGSPTKVAFFMRKGADCLSKWVGESERQLRLLFDQAHRMRPAIIFFDEIDGLAPIRSSRQDQIHSSIVSTLLSLIDGLDDRGDIIVIGATNRLDAIDPALRRPGRFDREFLFSLPDRRIRSEILQIHTQKWDPPLLSETIKRLASATSGFSGADLKALVVEAGLCSLRRRYPQIYRDSKKFQLNLDEIKVTEVDTEAALRLIRPSSDRSLTAPTLHRLPDRTQTLLTAGLSNLRTAIADRLARPDLFSPEAMSSSHEYSLFWTPTSSYSTQPPLLFRTTLLVTGFAAEHILADVLCDMPNTQVVQLDCVGLTSGGAAASVEERLCHQIREVDRATGHGVLFIPRLDEVWACLESTGRHLLHRLLLQTPPGATAEASLVLASISGSESEVDDVMWSELLQAFPRPLHLAVPDWAHRLAFFQTLQSLVLSPVCAPTITSITTETLDQQPPHCEEQLPEAQNTPPRPLDKHEKEKLEVEEELILRKFRMLLRKILSSLAKERKFQIFLSPVDEEYAPEYYSIISNPMDLSTMRNKVDLNNYETFDQFRSDLHLIAANALLYNPPRTSYLRDIRRHAYDFVDSAAAVLSEEVDGGEFEVTVSSVHTARTARGYYEQLAGVRDEASQPAVKEYLADLNGRQLPLQHGPLLAAQLRLYVKFYKTDQQDSRESGSSQPPEKRMRTHNSLGTRDSQMKSVSAGTRSQSDSEVILGTRNTGPRHTLRSHSVSQLSPINCCTTDVTASLDSFRKMKNARHKKPACRENGDQKDIVSAPATLLPPHATSVAAMETVTTTAVPPIKVDRAELVQVWRHAASRCADTSLRHMDSLYILLSSEARQALPLSNRAALPKTLMKIIDRYPRSS